MRCGQSPRLLRRCLALPLAFGLGGDLSGFDVHYVCLEGLASVDSAQIGLGPAGGWHGFSRF
eukprot:6892933-Prymnesium_polylepis.1